MEWMNFFLLSHMECLFLNKCKCKYKSKSVNQKYVIFLSVTFHFGITDYGFVRSIKVSYPAWILSKFAQLFLEVITIGIDTFLQSFGPAVSHGVVEFLNSDESDLLVNAALQFSDVLKDVSPQILLQSSK